MQAEQDLASILHGAEIFRQEQRIGIFCSGFGNQGIALIRENEQIPFSEGYIGDVKIAMKPAEWCL